MMAEVGCKLVAPKKKKRVRVLRHAPFPVPIRSITLETENVGRWYYYTGLLCGSAVVVSHTGDIHHLYNLGFFGKGNLSRSGLEFGKSFQSVVPPHADEKVLRVMKRQSYIRHLNWQKQSEAQQSGIADMVDMREYDSDLEPGEDQVIEEQNMVENLDTEKMASKAQGCSMVELSDNMDCHQLESEAERIEVDREGNSVTGHERKCEYSAEELWDTQEADADFWGCGEISSSGTQPVGVIQLEEVKSHEEDRIQSVEGDETCVEKLDAAENVQDFKQKNNFEIKRPSISGDLQKYKYYDRHEDQKEICSASLESGLASAGRRNGACCETLVLRDENLAEKDKGSQNLDNCEEVLRPVFSEEKICDKSADPLRTDSPHLQICGDFQTLEYSPGLESHPSSSKLVTPVLSCDPFCETNDKDGDVFVVADSDDEERFKPHWERVIKSDPYKLQEHLQLSLEEAFFLSYGLGCLLCKDQNQRSLNLTDMWQTFTKMKKSFLPSYVAYHHFRSKGWVPKPGIKFGVDYILYKEGPPFYHASYSVMVRLVDETTLKDNQDYLSRTMSWAALSGLNRITENVAKELMFCFVIRPSTLDQKEAESPGCIPQFKVQEMILKRWIPAQERQVKDLEDIL